MIGVLSIVLFNATRGGKKPLVDEEISNPAEALGLFVPIPTWA